MDAGAETFPRRVRILAPYVFLVLLLAVGTFVIWPQWRARNLAENERNAATIIKTLCSAEADFRANDRDGNGVNDFWTGDLAGLLRFGLISRAVAEADLRPLVPLVRKPVPYHGYYIIAMVTDESETPIEELRQETDKKSGKVHHRTKFGFCAYPVEYGVTGRNTFIVNENNTVFWRHTYGDPMDHWPSHEDQRHDWALGD
jgi:hypothetical protein